MAARSAPITVSTHVARDFLQNAAYFNTLPKVLWEYISNSLDNGKDQQSVNVVVDIYGSTVHISDDGMGMSRQDLQNFFRMHGENRQRQRGKRVRGRFGTGKCAAFGIANRLRIDTTQRGRRNVVELRRGEIESAKDGRAFPVNDLTVDEHTNQTDGTLVEISEFNIKRLDVEGATHYIQHHLSRYKQRARVVINGQECKFNEPPARVEYRVNPPNEIAQHIGEVTLLIKVSPIPLDLDNNGIDILSHGIWHQTTLAGLDNKEMTQYLFGEVDVPALEDKEWPVPAFDNTRNNTLNVQNPVVAVLLGWIAKELETVRRKLVEEERIRRQTEEAKRLVDEATRIAEILNEDFLRLQIDFEFARQIAARKGSTKVASSDGSTEPLPGGGEEPTKWQQTGAPYGNGRKGATPSSGDTPRPNGADLNAGSELGSPKTSVDRTRKPKQGLFSIEYRAESVDMHRSRYERDSRTIVINLDHPQISGAFNASGKNTESRQFREISYEVALVEYAIAIQYERIEQDDQIQAVDALYEVRETINRVAKRFASIM